MIFPVHPRVCGEHGALCVVTIVGTGSSPRVRGTRSVDKGTEGCKRFIPACAGEHCLACLSVYVPFGSSPRVRGTLDLSFGVCTLLRFIPACAGNTHPPAQMVRPAAVHPRVCGEHGASSPATSLRQGSSPRVRGTQHYDREGTARFRFIPACAGNTQAGRSY